tara:strand:+ start:2877 stop:3527 length:651 start_codon:yes stop_codon:yes gene_type:complete
MTGQVNRGSLFGEKIFQYSSNKNFKNFVEVGTWNGEGSTKCFMDALLGRVDESCLYSLEANVEFYNQASNYWAPVLMGPAMPFNKLNLLYGRIIEIEDLVSIQEVRGHSIFSQHPWLEWRERNVSEYGQCNNVLDEMPAEIDVLCLDGGQFSTRAEFDTLKDRTKVVMLDDTTTFKTESVKKEILSQSDIWSIILNLPQERHGMMIACKSEYSHLL